MKAFMAGMAAPPILSVYARASRAHTYTVDKGIPAIPAIDRHPPPIPDPDADPDERETSCIVEPADVPKATRKPVRRDVALDALRETVAEFGERAPGTSTIPAGVRAVTLDQWKARWALRTGYDEATGLSVRVNFHKDKDALLKAGAVAISKPYVWLAA